MTVPERIHDVLFTDGDFRLVRANRNKVWTEAFIQHNHPELIDSARYNNTSFDWRGGWIYCLGSTGSCTECTLKVPKAMGGLMKLENWDQ